MEKIVRVFSAAGPCLKQGRLVKETDQFYVFDEWQGGDRYEGRKKLAKGRCHLEPCKRCRDHADLPYYHGVF